MKLDNHLAYVYSFIHEQDSKPNKSINERFIRLKAQLDTAALDFQSLVDTDLKLFIELLEEHNVPRIIYKNK